MRKKKKKKKKYLRVSKHARIRLIQATYPADDEISTKYIC